MHERLGYIILPSNSSYFCWIISRKENNKERSGWQRISWNKGKVIDSSQQERWRPHRRKMLWQSQVTIFNGIWILERLKWFLFLKFRNRKMICSMYGTILNSGSSFCFEVFILGLGKGKKAFRRLPVLFLLISTNSFYLVWVLFVREIFNKVK
jgi:hypothetical protein